MSPIYVFLTVVFVLLAAVGLVAAVGFIIWIIARLSKRRSCWPFKYGGFDSDNGYENWRRK